MNTNLENKLSGWKNPPSQSEEERIRNTVNEIKTAINNSSALSGKEIKIFESGSYRNNTNVKLNSDIDVCVMLDSAFYFQLPEGKNRADFGLNSPSEYSFDTFKDSVELALIGKFGNDVLRGNKSIKIRPNTYRINADIVPCFRLERYTGGLNVFNRHVTNTGIKFFADDGTAVVNFPDQHYYNGVEKNKNTGMKYKELVRILKKLNYEMENNNVEISKKISSFLIECLVWNTPNNILLSSTNYTDILKSVLAHLYEHTKSEGSCDEWGEVSELLYLFRGNRKWTKQDVNKFAVDAWDFLNF